MQQVFNADFADIYIPVPIYPDAVGTVGRIVWSAQDIPAGEQPAGPVKDTDTTALGDVNGIVSVNVQSTWTKAPWPLGKENAIRVKNLDTIIRLSVGDQHSAFSVRKDIMRKGKLPR